MAGKEKDTLLDYSVFSVPSVAINHLTIRRATLADAQAIADLVNVGVREGQLLPRSLDSIRATIDDWMIALDERGIVGVGSLVEMNHALAEVRSLVVAPTYRQFGIGAQIVNALIELARERNIPYVFTLTRAVLFFEKLGFNLTDKENFPEKVWRDCSNCPVQFACDEVAMVRSVASQQRERITKYVTRET